MKPGIYFDMPFKEYFAVKAFSNSWASYLDECPAILKANMDFSEERDTPALRLGRAVHEAVFDRQTFMLEKNFKVMPKFGRSNVDKEAKEKFLQEFQERTCISQDEQYEALDISDAVLKTKTATRLFEEVSSEVSIFWECPHTGVLCKGRIDGWNGVLKVLLDLKTTSESLHKDSLQRVISARKYYRQLAWYSMGLEALGKEVEMQVLIFVQKRKPFPVVFKCLDFESVEQGKREMKDLVEKYSICLAKDKWPSYPDMVTAIGLPEWAKKYENSQNDFSEYENVEGANE